MIGIITILTFKIVFGIQTNWTILNLRPIEFPLIPMGVWIVFVVLLLLNMPVNVVKTLTNGTQNYTLLCEFH